jgi:hypothetical protein
MTGLPSPMGDRKAGRKIVDDGFGYRIGSFIPANPKAVPSPPPTSTARCWCWCRTGGQVGARSEDIEQIAQLP